jgi:hypothetical protein
MLEEAMSVMNDRRRIRMSCPSSMVPSLDPNRRDCWKFHSAQQEFDR